MHFMNPWALWGLVSVPAILALYLFKQAYSEKKVPSLFLWQSFLLASESKRSWQKLRKNLLMLLQVLCAILFTLALARPYVIGSFEKDNIILVLDTSLSMQTQENGETRFLQAKAQAQKIIEGSLEGSTFSLVLLDKNPTIVVANTQDKRVLLDKLNTLTASFAKPDHVETAQLVSTLQKQNRANIFVLTDSDFSFLGLPHNLVLLGDNKDNLAITSLTYSFDSDHIVAMAKVKNFGANHVSNSLSIYADEKIIEVVDFSLVPQQEKDFFFTSLEKQSQTIVARLATSDHLPADDVAYACVYEETAKKTLLFTNGNVFLENMLSILPNVELFQGKLDQMEHLSGYYLYIFDGVLPQELPTDGHILVFNPPVGNLWIQTENEEAVSTVLTTNPNANSLQTIFGDTNQFSMDISKAKRLVKPTWADVVLTDGHLPLVLTGEQNNRKFAVFAFDLHNSDLPLKKEFPIFMYYLCQWFMPQNPFGNEPLFAEDVISLSVLPNAKQVQVVLPNNEVVLLSPPFPVPMFAQTQETGVYLLEQTLQEETLYTQFAVNAASGEESNLLRQKPKGIYLTNGLEENQANSQQKTIQGNKEYVYVVLAFLLFCLLLEWVVYTKRHTA